VTDVDDVDDVEPIDEGERLDSGPASTVETVIETAGESFGEPAIDQPAIDQPVIDEPAIEVPAAAEVDLAIPDYDSLAASQVVPRLAGLTGDELESVRAYESAHRGRTTILTRIAQLQRS
jgi:hypothetical protein